MPPPRTTSRLRYPCSDVDDDPVQPRIALRNESFDDPRAAYEGTFGFAAFRFGERDDLPEETCGGESQSCNGSCTTPPPYRIGDHECGTRGRDGAVEDACRSLVIEVIRPGRDVSRAGDGAKDDRYPTRGTGPRARGDSIGTAQVLETGGGSDGEDRMRYGE